MNYQSKKAVYDSLFLDYCKKYSNENELTLLIKHVMPWIMEMLEKLELRTDAELPSTHEEWITSEELCAKYPFIRPSAVYEISRHAADNQNFFRYEMNNKKRQRTFNPKNLMIYVSSNKHIYSKLYAALVRSRFFGVLDEQPR